ncbi:nucleolar protein 4 [Caerostris extrusa]|uniref:Nucleolar protein 4 n=1 Tax=Caerostris extrusa TaxID=172846 RepID=A0AAV4M6C4_CAEEX|nr:nucleolar protein 4 [Caerostris extrusa]
MVYKKVAVVENFYDIIYGVHVEMDGRGGKHAGQKRTYKAIAEMYSFLPREAVTHFLMSCTDCQKRMHLGADQQQKTSTGNHDNGHHLDESISSLDTTAGDDTDSLHIDYSLPITTTYLKHMRSLGYSEEDALNPDREVSKHLQHFDSYFKNVFAECFLDAKTRSTLKPVRYLASFPSIVAGFENVGCRVEGSY